MAVKIGKALGTEVTVLSTSEQKRKDAKRLGAFDFALATADETSEDRVVTGRRRVSATGNGAG